MDEILIRPSYKTDPNHIKGMQVAIDVSTGKIIKRNFDNVYSKLTPEQQQNSRRLSYDEVDWQLAGYDKN
jgi:hypothetical protein